MNKRSIMTTGRRMWRRVAPVAWPVTWGLAVGAAVTVGSVGVNWATDTGDFAPRRPAPVTVTLSAPLTQAMSACAGLDINLQRPCVALALQPASTVWRGSDGSVSTDPSGLALVRECREQYQGTELRTCLTGQAFG